MDPAQNLLSRAEYLAGDHLEFQRLKPIQRGAVRIKSIPPLQELDIEDLHIQPPPGRHLGILLTQRAGGTVAGIGQQILAIQLSLLVDGPKHGFGHKHLTPNNEPLRRPLEAHGNGTDGTQILCHVLTGLPISPSCAPNEHTVFVFQRNGQSVHLWFHDKGRILCSHGDSVNKLQHLRIGEYVLKGLQRHGMVHRGKRGQRLASHTLSG